MKRLFGRSGRSERDAIIIVSGLPRSGTSLMMRMLEAGGLSTVTDGVRSADHDNPRGYYELERVKKLSSGDVEWLADARGKAVKVIATLLYHLPPTHTYRIVFMRRDISEILASQRQMLINRGEDPDAVPEAEMARMFQGHLERLGPWVEGRADMEMLQVDHHALVAGDPTPAIEAVDRFLGGSLDTAAMRSVVDPELYRQRGRS